RLSGPGYPDYDYTLELRDGGSAGLFILDDLRGLFGSDYTSTSFAGEGKVATLTVPKFQIRVKSDSVTGYDRTEYPNELFDSRTAKAEVLVQPEGVDLSALGLSLSCEPAETGEYVNDGHGTDVTLTRTGPGTWKTSTIYWYGVRPDRECRDSKNAYRFVLSRGGTRVTYATCGVRFPEDGANANWRPPTSNDTAPGAPRHVQTATEDHWCCDIVFREFEKEAGYISTRIGTNNVPFTWTGQYAAQIRAEELFHLKQSRGEVPVSEGGFPDCFTVRGIQYFIRQQAATNSCIDTATWTVRGATAAEARTRAEGVIRQAVQEEIEKSRDIMFKDANRAYMELKAKEHAGYNACFRYHCTYERLPEYGPNPQRELHPAYQ
ncbi:MAG: hypothetical protein Q4G65_08630, partial [bacterium]|nr:hypothetical protein [bacterium]